MSFEKLSPEMQKIVKKRFSEPTLPQKLAIPKIIAGRNVLIIAQTGTGKTESAMLPILDFLMKNREKPIGALYVTPLKSLNRDMLDRMIWWGDQCGLEVSVRHGDTSQYERKLQLEFPPNLMVTTLETLQPLLTAKRFREHLRNVKHVVLDEVHETVDSKRGVQLTVALERLRELCGDFQLVMLSATVGEPKKVGEFFSGGREFDIVKADTEKKMDIRVINPDPVASDEAIAEKIFTSKETAARVRTIMEMVGKSRSSLIFTNTRMFAEVLASRIKTIDRTFPLEIHHSSLSKDVRVKAEKNFKSEKLKALVSTSSLQLGIDIGSVDLVLQYMSPREVSQLTQRVGRSGHELSKTSIGVIISTDADDIFESAVIARKAMAGEFEPVVFHNKPYDVLAHQIIGMTFDFGRVGKEKVYDVVRRAWPYRNLKYPEFLEVCEQLNRLGLIFLDDTINKKRRGFEYYFNQLSTIPDTKSYRVINMYDNSYVGVLDEEFIAVHGEIGANFILKSEAYRIVSIEGDKVMVEPVVDVGAAIPGWEGELIPVPYSVAQEVGRLRGEIAVWMKKSESEAKKRIMEKYPVDNSCAEKMISLVKKQAKSGIVPDDKTLLVEDYENIVVISSPFGSKVNDTLGRFISFMLTSRVGAVGLKTDPYRIMIQFQQKNKELVREILMQTDLKHFRTYVEMGLSRSELFEWKFVHVAKRFGAFSRQAEFGKIRLKKIVEDFAGTPLYEETLKELETEKMDLELALDVLEKIQSGEYNLVFKDGISAINRLGLEHKYAEIIGPEKPEAEIFSLFKKRLLSAKTTMLCINCGEWSQTYECGKVPDSLKCGRCSSRLLAPTGTKGQEAAKLVRKALKKSELTPDEEKRWEGIKSNAEMFMNYKSRAAVALSGRGVGPATARRLLARWYKDDDSFLKAILEAERAFVKNRQFWSG
jgi:ATP-dependent Lhr-like helicase